MSAIQSAQSDFRVIEELLRRTYGIKHLEPLESARDEYDDGAASRESGDGNSDDWRVVTIIRSGQIRLIYRDGIFWGAQKGYGQPKPLADQFTSLKEQAASPALVEGAL
ncbi:hypothetical protein JOE31_004089 [Arthrobacter sp. PvP023]|uniref:hypothetical protein n=1 Tax=Micrococcaceae TaxID=1268 RepID=UPI001AE9D13B|nr:hypothetical protein [Arthrobacter sp. PvP023]MBP1137857.1 hypothetical protein [Arthrobacter sp. PvP023]